MEIVPVEIDEDDVWDDETEEIETIYDDEDDDDDISKYKGIGWDDL